MDKNVRRTNRSAEKFPASLFLHFTPTEDMVNRLCSGSHAGHVRVRMVNRNRVQRIPTVRELIDQLNKRQDRVLVQNEIEQEKHQDHKLVPVEAAHDDHFTIVSSQNTPQPSYNPAEMRICSDKVINSVVLQAPLPAVSWQPLLHADVEGSSSAKQGREYPVHTAGVPPLSAANNNTTALSWDSLNTKHGFTEELPSTTLIQYSQTSKLNQNSFRPNGLRTSLCSQVEAASKLAVMGRLSDETHTVIDRSEPVADVTDSQDDIVAMGIMWPNVKIQTGHSQALRSIPGTSAATSRRILTTATTTSVKQLGFRQAKDKEIQYTDPVMGASPSFQTRLIELSTMESDTVRWERNKRNKRRAKQDRDSS